MVKDAKRRIEKYRTGIDPALTAKKLESIRDVMVELESPYLAEIAEIERKVKQICENQGIATILVAQYINVARKMYSLSKKFSGATLAAEFQYLVNLWISRGLLGAKLVEIAGLFSVTPTAPVPPSVLPPFNPYIHYPTIPVMSPIGGYFPSAYWLGGPEFTDVWEGSVVTQCHPVLRRFRIDRLCVYLRTDLGAPRQIRLTLYDDNGHCYPNTVLEDSGVINLTGAKFYTYTVNRWLEKGIYWLVWQANHDDSEIYWSRYHPAVLGIQTAPSHTWQAFICWAYDQAFGAPPDPFPVWTDPNVWWDFAFYSMGWRIAELG